MCIVHCDIKIYNIIKSYFCILTIVRKLTKYVMQLMQPCIRGNKRSIFEVCLKVYYVNFFCSVLSVM